MRFFGWFYVAETAFFTCGHKQVLKMKDRKRGFKWNFSKEESSRKDCLSCYLVKHPEQGTAQQETDEMFAVAKLVMLTGEVIVIEK